MKAVKVVKTGQIAVVEDAPVPAIKDGEILARAHAWAINPGDIHQIHGFAPAGSTAGMDWSGVITEVGPGVTGYKVGDEVWGACHGGNVKDLTVGAFADIVRAKAFAIGHKPPNMTFEEAATLGISLGTIGQTMFYTMKLGPFPTADGSEFNGKKLLVYGASSGTGAIAVQIAALCGFEVFAIASSRNFGMVKERGAHHVFDYKDEDVLDQIQAKAQDSITSVIDCIGSDDSVKLCAQLLSSKGGKYHSIAFPLSEMLKQLRPEPEVIATTAIAYTLLGEGMSVPGIIEIPSNPDEYDFLGEWSKVLRDLLKAGKILPHPVHLGQPGLEGLVQALNDFKGLSPSGKKVVCAAA